jgi:hypothetical protein
VIRYRPRKPLLWFAALQSLMSLEVAVVFGLPASSSQHFCATLVFPRYRPPLSRERVNSLMSSASTSETNSLVTRLSRRATGTSPWVSFPFATSAHGVHFPLSFQTQLRSALSVSHTLDGLLLPVPSWVCFVPQPRPGFHFRGFPCRSADSSHRRLVPSCRYRRPPAAE